LKHKDIISLKNGLYVSADFYDKNKNDISYSFYLANILRKPSYISSWTALQYYNLATEAIKVTRSYKTKVGNFAYQSVNEKLFSDFVSVKGKFDFFIASPSKALFDLLYLKTQQFKSLESKNINSLIEELRIDISDMDEKEQKKFYDMINKYTNHE
jgi:predicted transcriptional regulator of viral defense system